MKKLRKLHSIVLSFILVFSMLAGSISVQGQEKALDETRLLADCEELIGIEMTDEEYADYLESIEQAEQEAYAIDSVYAISDYSIFSNDYCKNMLNEVEQNFYDELYEAAINILSTDADCEKAGNNYVIGSASYAGMTKERAKEILAIFIYQNSQFYFIDTKFMISTNSQIIAPCVYEIFADGDARDDVTDEFFGLVEGWLDELEQCANDYEIIVEAHDIVCDHVVYGSTTATYNQSAYSAVILKDTVCAGYAKFYSILLNGSGVDCISVTGTDHAWNLVNLYGNWYNVDTTWDDDDFSGNHYTSYLLKSDDTITSGHVREDIYYVVAPDCEIDYSGSGEVTTPIPVSSISLDSSEVVLEIDGSNAKNLTALIYPSNATDKNYSWGVENASVATISDDGVVTAVAPGETVVYAVAGDGYFRAECKVYVYGSQDSPNAPTVMGRSTDTITLVYVVGCEYSMDKVNWQSSSTFTGLTPDTSYTFYMRRAAQGYYRASKASAATTTRTFPIYVTDIDINIDNHSFQLGEGENQINLTVSILPENASYKTCTWSSSNPNVATVSADGTVTAVSPGVTEIVATSGDGFSSDTCVVTVYGKYDVPDMPSVVEISTNSITLTQVAGCEYSMDKVNWQTSNTFFGLNPNKTYTFYMRKAATTYWACSDPTAGLPVTTDKLNVTVSSGGLYVAEHDNEHALVGMTTTTTGNCDLEYQWLACKTSDEKWFLVKDWTLNNEWLDWEPEESGDYVLLCKVRVVGNEDSVAEASVGINHHKYIKGKCQMPYDGEGGGYLIGFETYDNPGGKYKYEMLILDCTLLAQGKDAWIYTTGQCYVPENCFWTIWQPQYGYYWTLFRLYDEDGNLIDEECYGFENIC